MTAAVNEPDAAERRVIAAIKGLRAMQGVPVPELCELLHISRGTWFSRMNDGQFTVGQVSKLAERFGVKVQAIMDGVAYSAADDVRQSDRFTGEQPSRQKVNAKLRALAGGGQQTPAMLPALRLISQERRSA